MSGRSGRGRTGRRSWCRWVQRSWISATLRPAGAGSALRFDQQELDLRYASVQRSWISAALRRAGHFGRSSGAGSPLPLRPAGAGSPLPLRPAGAGSPLRCDQQELDLRCAATDGPVAVAGACGETSPPTPRTHTLCGGRALRGGSASPASRRGGAGRWRLCSPTQAGIRTATPASPGDPSSTSH